MAINIKVNADQLRNSINELSLEETPLAFHISDTKQLLVRLERGEVESEAIGELQAAISLMEEAQFGLNSMVNELIAFLERYQKLQSLPLPVVSHTSILSIDPSLPPNSVEGAVNNQAPDTAGQLISFAVLLAKKLRKGIPDATFRTLLKERLLKEFGITIDDVKEWKTEELVLLAQAVQDFQQGAGWTPAQFKKVMTKDSGKQVLFKRIHEARNTTFAQTQIFTWPDITVEFYDGWAEQKSALMKRWAVVHELAHVMDKENDDKNHANYTSVSDGYNYFDAADNKLKYGIKNGIMATIYGTTGDQEDWAESVTAYIYRNMDLVINDAVAWRGFDKKFFNNSKNGSRLIFIAMAMAQR